jgi:L-amino acid N-acyltransferase YncA
MYTRLSDGTELLIREIRPSDKAQLATGITRLSEASRRSRFLSPKPRLSTAELRYLTEVDGFDHYALVAVEPGRDGNVVAVARFIRELADPEAAEAAVTVCDNLQGKGLGKTLARMVGDAARQRGIRRIHATILSDNPPALALMNVIAERLSDGGHAQGIHEVVAELAA